MIKHLSIRVPWHDNGWNATVCKYPQRNQACRAIRAIAEAKDDENECQYAGVQFSELGDNIPPCLYCSGAFMSKKSFKGMKKGHPYTYDDRFNHIEPTSLKIEPYSFIATPFSWTLREKAQERVSEGLFYLQYDEDIEPMIGSNNWVSNGNNQKEIFDYFYKHIEPNQSMVVAYAKTVPFIETLGRIIIGIGMVSSVEKLHEYDYNRKLTESDNRSFLWERQIGHSIRDNQENGFLFPFEKIQEHLTNNPDQDPEELIVIAPDGYFEEFSYACEHVSHDALIITLNKAIAVLRKYRELGITSYNGSDWTSEIAWCKSRLEALWVERGLYPGLGSVLQTSGLKYGEDIALGIREKVSDDELWDKMGEIINNIGDYLPDYMSDADLRNIGKSKLKAQFLLDSRMKSSRLKMISRIKLTTTQCKVALNPTSILISKYNKPHYSDFISNIKNLNKESIVDNPYLLFEQTRLFEENYRFAIEQIDIAMFPHHCLKAKSVFDSYDDERRLRAIIVSILENAAQRGSSLLTATDVIRKIKIFISSLIDDEPLDIDIDILEVFDEFFSREFKKVKAKEDERNIFAYQLNRISDVGDSIRNFVKLRLDENIDINDDWAERLKSLLLHYGQKEFNEDAHREQINAIKIMAESKLSILTGGAGTGKTTMLVALCMSPEIQKNDIIVLAPTGKARVVLASRLNDMGIENKDYTVFQFLQKSNHCDYKSMRYYLSDKHSDEATNSTLIIDECSMLTEEMMGALGEAARNAKRVILVGDPNQLPPIGTGKPFFEITEYLRLNHLERYAKLTVSHRQKGGARLDSLLAKLFTYDQSKEVPDDIFSLISDSDTNIEFVKFNGDSDLNDILFETIKEATEMDSVDDVYGFDVSLGGVENDGHMIFGGEKNVSALDNWQILSPYRNDNTSGSSVINHLIQDKYRLAEYEDVPQKIETTKPLGNDSILYGEKVINVQNQKAYIPALEKKNDVANGELGIVEGFFKYGNYHKIRFTSQPDVAYSFASKISESDSDSPELAYALTVHKSQGSGFKKAILVINEPESGANCFISREMIYTALTRQKQKLYILYNKDPSELKKYSYSSSSDLSGRLTNLFGIAEVVNYKGKFYAENLIHISRSGEPVRSKSEVIIYNELVSAKISFKYEESAIVNGKRFSPDFTIYLPNGDVKYWEHLGMLSNPKYEESWERKKAMYEAGGISEALGNLIITVDKPNGGIDSKHIAKIVEEL